MELNNYPLWTALITPMFENGAVDYASLGKLLKEQEEANNGILILGSTGEALNLDAHESRKILDFSIAQNLKVPLMCGVGGINLEQTRQWVQYLETLKLDAYLMVTPLYAKPGMKGQTVWFKTLMDTATKPVMLYNVPGRTGCPLNIDTVKALANHPRLWAIKEASGSCERFAEYVKAAPNARVYSGDDGMTPHYAPLGCKGLVSVASNVWPKATHVYTKQCLSGELKDIALWERSADSLFLASNPIPAKRIMAHQNRISTPVLKSPLDHRDLEQLAPVIEADKEINNWFNTL
jgi:4-hydroxy-tetrahydrodipicolinate synthase